MAEVFNLNHETGDLSQYDGNSLGAQISATGAAALGGGGNFGQQTVIQNNFNSRYFFKTLGASTPATVPIWRYRFYIDMNSGPGMGAFDETEGCSFYLGINLSTRVVIFGPASGSSPANGYQFRLDAARDGGGLSSTAKTALTDGPHIIEVRLQASSAPATADGRVDIWVDVDPGTAPPTASILSWTRFDDGWPTQARVGFRDSTPLNTWTCYVDEIVARDDDQVIGPAQFGPDGPGPYVSGDYVAGAYIPADYESGDYR